MFRISMIMLVVTSLAAITGSAEAALGQHKHSLRPNKKTDDAGVAGNGTAVDADADATAVTSTNNADAGDDNDSNNNLVVSVRFYGEAQCPYCRKFVTDVWPEIWNDLELRALVDYDFIPWGNAYFATEECGTGPAYSSEERQCWYSKCLGDNGDGDGDNTPKLEANTVANVVTGPTTNQTSDVLDLDDNVNNDTVNTDTDSCFSGTPIYQHSQKEGQVNIYETCVKQILGLEAGVAFMYCCEGASMDDDDKDDAAHVLMLKCLHRLPSSTSPAAGPHGANVTFMAQRQRQTKEKDVQDCLEQRGKQIEIDNAKQTPAHMGVPYVVVDGQGLDEPFAVKDAICASLVRSKKKKNIRMTNTTSSLPKACGAHGSLLQVEEDTFGSRYH
jgi:hypothetical protein